MFFFCKNFEVRKNFKIYEEKVVFEEKKAFHFLKSIFKKLWGGKHAGGNRPPCAICGIIFEPVESADTETSQNEMMVFLAPIGARKLKNAHVQDI